MFKVGIIVFPGSNCHLETVRFFNTFDSFDVSQIWHKETSLPKLDLYVLPGGFSYGDYLRSGKLASMSPIMNDVEKYATEGRFILGICNGFQILCERNILPGTLRKNFNQKFICQSVPLKDRHDNNYTLPIAHKYGAYYNEDHNFNIAYTYTSNINGSKDKIAGIYNANLNVMGLMPHPERAFESFHSSQDGPKIIKNFLK